MLVLSRKTNQQIIIGDDIRITLLRIEGNKVRIGIDAPKQIRVLRGELNSERPVTADDSIHSEGQISEREEAFAHPSRIAKPQRGYANSHPSQLFIGTVDRNGDKPQLSGSPLPGVRLSENQRSRAPLAEFISAS